METVQAERVLDALDDPTRRHFQTTSKGDALRPRTRRRHGRQPASRLSASQGSAGRTPDRGTYRRDQALIRYRHARTRSVAPRTFCWGIARTDLSGSRRRCWSADRPVRCAIPIGHARSLPFACDRLALICSAWNVRATADSWPAWAWPPSTPCRPRSRSSTEDAGRARSIRERRRP